MQTKTDTQPIVDLVLKAGEAGVMNDLAEQTYLHSFRDAAAGIATAITENDVPLRELSDQIKKSNTQGIDFDFPVSHTGLSYVGVAGQILKGTKTGWEGADDGCGVKEIMSIARKAVVAGNREDLNLLLSGFSAKTTWADALGQVEAFTELQQALKDANAETDDDDDDEPKAKKFENLIPGTSGIQKAYKLIEADETTSDERDKTALRLTLLKVAIAEIELLLDRK